MKYSRIAQTLTTPINAHRESMGSFSVETVVRGFHVYNEVWDAAVGEELPCRRDVGNSHDPYAVAMVRASTTAML